LDEFNEVIFFQQGIVDIGFEVNRVKTWVLRQRNRCIIGDYGLTYNKRSLFLFRTTSACFGYSVRRTNWKNLIANHPEISELMKEQIKKDYDILIERVLEEKESMIRKWNKRSDYNGILSVISNDFNSLNARKSSVGKPLAELKEEEEHESEEELDI